MTHYEQSGYLLAELGDQMVPGFCAGDKIKHSYYGVGWVSNIVSDRDDEFVHTQNDPDTWHRGDPAHGHYCHPGNVTMIEPFGVPTDEEVAELFGLVLTTDDQEIL